MTGQTATLGPILAAPAGALACYLLARLSARSPVPDLRGWRRVRPGAMHWTGLVLSGGLVGLMGWIGLFVGSARADASFQMRVLWCLFAAFALGALGCFARIRSIAAAAVTWRGRQLAFTPPGGARRVCAMDAITRMERTAWGATRLRFADGAMLDLDPYAAGSAALCERIAEGETR